MSRFRKCSSRAIIAACVFSLFGSALRADTYLEYLQNVAVFRGATAVFAYTLQEERDAIAGAYAVYLAQQKLKARKAAGQVALAGDYPFSSLALGDTATLTFFFVDPENGLPTTTGIPAVDHVDYIVNTDPFNPLVFTSLGSSSSAGTNFALSYTVSGFEPEIQGIPYDALSNPIFLEGVDASDNIAAGVVTNLTVPEPNAGLLLLSGVAVILRRRTRRT